MQFPGIEKYASNYKPMKFLYQYIGDELSCGPVVMGASCHGGQLSWGPVVMGASCRGPVVSGPVVRGRIVVVPCQLDGSELNNVC